MTFLDRLEKHGGRWAIPHLTGILVMGQVLTFLMQSAGLPVYEALSLESHRVLAGEIWRLLTFVLLPPPMNIIFAFFAWYMFYLMGSALEHQWGAFRYTLFLFTGWAMTVGATFLMPGMYASNVFLGGSVFLAFAWLFPDFEIYLFFILPIRIKWLALIAWISYLFMAATGTGATRLMIVASVANYLLFFGKDIIRRAREGHRTMRRAATSDSKAEAPFHRCAVCGRTEVSHPDLEFRYCTTCRPTCGYCMDHLNQHTHRAENTPLEKT